MNTLQVKFDGSIETLRMNGEIGSSAACVDAQGNRYALLRQDATRWTAWDCNPEHNAVECELVTEFDVVVSAQAEFERVLDAAANEFERTNRDALAEYERAIEPAKKAYSLVTLAASVEYGRVRGNALVTYERACGLPMPLR